MITVLSKTKTKRMLQLGTTWKKVAIFTCPGCDKEYHVNTDYSDYAKEEWLNNPNSKLRSVADENGNETILCISCWSDDKINLKDIKDNSDINRSAGGYWPHSMPIVQRKLDNQHYKILDGGKI